MPVKLLIGLGMDAAGRQNDTWVEEHLYLSLPAEGKTLVSLWNNFLPLVQARAALLGKNGFLIGVRASVQDVVGQKVVGSRQSRSFWADDPQWGMKPFSSPFSQTCEPQPDALRLTTYGSADGMRGNIWLTGCPDALFATGTGDPADGENANPGPRLGAVPGWEQLLNAYKAILTNGSWGMWATANPPASGYVPVTGWSNEGAAPNRLIATFPSATLSPPVNTVIQFKAVGYQNLGRFRPVDGRWRVAAVAAGAGSVSVTLNGTDGLDAALIKRNGYAFSVLPTPVPYLEVSGLEQGRHKRGASFARPVGVSRRARDHSV